MKDLQLPPDPNLLVGLEGMDDAGVYKLTDRIALVQTVDYITPMIDDPHLFGQIAAANALSDVYAMGGRPLTAMNLCNFPRRARREDLRRILEGGLSKIQEAGAALVGGQTVEDNELKYGLSVTGVIDPGRVLANSGAKPGDRLVLTKPVGTGVLINARKLGRAGDEILAEACRSMARLNRQACEAMLRYKARACTDITGYGLAGHAWNIARASRVSLRFSFDALPKFPASLDWIRKGVTTGLTEGNRRNLAGSIRFDPSITSVEQTLMFDPQTSGGLLISVDPQDAPALVDDLRKGGAPESADVGEVIAGAPALEVLR